MSAEAIATLVASGVALITSVFTLLISFYIQARRDTKKKRLFPIVSILDNKNEIINERLKHSSCRIFFNIKYKEELTKHVYYYFLVRNENKSYQICNCQVSVILEGNQNQTHTFHVGTIIYGAMVVIPIRINSDDKRFIIEVEYKTEGGEKLKYIVNAHIDFTNRVDGYAIWHPLTKKYSKPIELNQDLTLSYMTDDFYKNDEFSFDLIR